LVAVVPVVKGCVVVVVAPGVGWRAAVFVLPFPFNITLEQPPNKQRSSRIDCGSEVEVESTFALDPRNCGVERNVWRLVAGLRECNHIF
jgi:hypothetical protein